jgi:hypothetical protein
MRVRTVALSPTTPRANASVAVTEARPIANAGRERLAVTAHVTSRAMGPGRPMTAMLRLNGRPSGTRVLTMNAAGDTKIAFDPVAIPVGLVRGEVTIDADSLAADDTARFTLTSNDEVRVLLVAPDDAERDETLYIERALAVGRAPSVRLQRVRPSAIDADELRDVALVLLWDSPLPNGRALDALRAWTTRGGGLVQLAGRRLGSRSSSATLLPASVASIADRSDDRGGSLGDVRIDHPLLAPFRETPAALVAPRFLRHARLEPANGGEVVARFDDGSAAIVERTEGTGRVIELGMPLDARAGDFPLQPAYLPFVRRLVLYSTGRATTPLARATGETWLLPAAAREPVVSTPDGSIVRPARDSRATSVPLRAAGLYVLHDGETRGAPVAELAVNTPAAESDLATDHGGRSPRRRSARRREHDDVRDASRSRRDRAAAGTVAHRDRRPRRAAPARDADGEPRLARHRQSCHHRPVFRRRLMTQADQLLASLAVLRRQWRRRILLEAVAWVALAAVIGLVVAFAISRFVPACRPGARDDRVVAYGLIVGTLIRFLVLPLARRTSDQRFALYVEEHAPGAEAVAALRRARAARTEELRSSRSLAERLTARTVTALRPLQSDGRIERPRTVRALRVLGGTVVLGALLVLAGPDGLRDTARALFVPWATPRRRSPSCPCVSCPATRRCRRARRWTSALHSRASRPTAPSCRSAPTPRRRGRGCRWRATRRRARSPRGCSTSRRPPSTTSSPTTCAPRSIS